MTPDKAIADGCTVYSREHIPLAHALRSVKRCQPFASANVWPSTAREIEVLRLVTQGLTTTQIAQQLIKSPRLPMHTLRSIYSKLEVTSRAAATPVPSNTS
jgi:DNA-binding NarL/FixJ family response regulator